MTAYYLGVDGGGSKTAAVVVDESMQVLGRAFAGGSNHLRVGIDEATRELERAIDGAVATASLTTGDLEYAYLGIAGSDHPLHRERVVEAIRVFLPKSNYTVDSDARIALTAGIGEAAGLIVIAGTGSVAYGRNGNNEEARAGGWGPTIGDEGSGYSIARRGLSAIIRAHDGRGPQTLMTDLLCSEYGMCNPEDLPRFVYAPSTHSDDIAAYARLVIDAASQGDEIARQIYEIEGRELGITALAVARRLKLVESGFPIAHVGGAFHAGALLLDPFKAVVLAQAPGAVIQPPLEMPVMGAARMAIRAARDPRPSRTRRV